MVNNGVNFRQKAASGDFENVKVRPLLGIKPRNSKPYSIVDLLNAH